MIHFKDGVGIYFVLPGVRDDVRQIKQRAKRAGKAIIVVGESQPFLAHFGPGKGQKWVKLTGKSAFLQPSSFEEWLEWCDERVRARRICR